MVSARRVLIEGMLNEVPSDCTSELVLGGEFGHLAENLQADASFGHDDRREVQPHPELLPLDLVLADRHLSGRGGLAGIACWDRKLAARHEIGALARDCGQVRLGQGANYAGRSMACSVADIDLKVPLKAEGNNGWP